MTNAIRVLFLAGFTAAALSADDSATVVVHLTGSNLVRQVVLLRAQAAASQMFAAAGVRLEWAKHENAPSPGPACAANEPQEINIRLTWGWTRAATAEAFAIAYPYAGSGVRVKLFADLVRDAAQQDFRREAAILAHVFVHEITHVLQGVARHSASGVMQARWTSKQLRTMEDHPLPFTPGDTDLIRTSFAQPHRPGCAEPLSLTASASTNVAAPR